MFSRSRLSPSTSWRLKTPRGRSDASISQSPLRATRSARTVRTLRSTSRSIESFATPGRSNSIRKTSPSRQASIGITAGRFVVPRSWPARRSNSRNGSVVRSNMACLLSCSCRGECHGRMCNVCCSFYIALDAGDVKSSGERNRFMTEEPGLYAISVAAERADMQIQNLRVYERRGLLEPARTPGGTRLYSEADIAVLRRIAELLAEGLNLAGIRRVLELEAEVALLRQRLGE